MNIAKNITVVIIVMFFSHKVSSQPFFTLGSGVNQAVYSLFGDTVSNTFTQVDNLIKRVICHVRELQDGMAHNGIP